MNRNTRRAITRFGALSILPLAFGAYAADDGADEAAHEPLDTITIIGRKTDVADVPGSAHVVGSEELALFNTADILRALRTVLQAVEE